MPIKLPKNVISRYQYMKDLKNDTDSFIYTLNGFEDNCVYCNASVVPDNIPGFNFWNVNLSGKLVKPTFINKISRGREYLGKDVDYFINYESGQLVVQRLNCIKQDKYRIRLTDYFITTKHVYPNDAFTFVVYNYLKGKNLPDYNSVREIHKIKDGVIFSTDLFLEKKMYLTVKGMNYEYSDIVDFNSDLIHLKNLPKTIEAYKKEKLQYTINVDYDHYGLVKEYKKNDSEINKCKYTIEENGCGALVTTTYPLFLEKFDLKFNEMIGDAYVSETMTLTDEYYTYIREIKYPET